MATWQMNESAQKIADQVQELREQIRALREQSLDWGYSMINACDVDAHHALRLEMQRALHSADEALWELKYQLNRHATWVKVSEETTERCPDFLASVDYVAADAVGEVIIA